jgi:hypothetical protein
MDYGNFWKNLKWTKWVWNIQKYFKKNVTNVFHDLKELKN